MKYDIIIVYLSMIWIWYFVGVSYDHRQIVIDFIFVLELKYNLFCYYQYFDRFFVFIF